MIKTMEKPWEFMSSSLHKVCQYYVNENHGNTRELGNLLSSCLHKVCEYHVNEKWPGAR